MAKHVKAVNNIASGVAVLHKNCVLLAKRCDKCHITGGPIPFAGYWSIFAGTVDPGETPKECAGRELYLSLIHISEPTRLLSIGDGRLGL